MKSEFPEDLLYTKEHEWVRKISDDVVVVGITTFAGEQLGDIVNVELPAEGEEIEAGDVFGTVESVKAVSDLFSPVTGTILRINDPLLDSPENANDDPYDEGWMVEITLEKGADLSELMTPESYAEYLESIE